MMMIIIIILFISLSILTLYNSYKLREFFDLDYNIYIPETTNTNTIFISIASYRDPEAPKTVKDLLNKAEHPELLNIVVYEQNSPNDSKVDKHPNVKIISDDYTLAKGPNWARYMIQRHYSGEEYYMQIDSHTRVVEHWDTKLKKMLKILPDKSILTQYPPEYNIQDGSFDKEQIRSGLYIQGFGISDKFTRIQSDIIDNTKLKRDYPYTNKAWAACFSFSRGEMVMDAPYDPWLPHLFFGEEFDITLRLFTRGWNFYSPNISIVFTTFDRSHRRAYWEDLNFYERKLYETTARKRLCNRIGILFIPEYIDIPLISSELLMKNSDRFSLGTVRNLKDYEKFADIESLNLRKMLPRAKTFRRFSKRLLLR